MNYTALRAAILASPDCAPYVVTNDMPKQNAAQKDQTIAEILNAPVGERLVERFENFIGLMAALGLSTYNGVMRSLEAAAANDALMNDVLLAIRSDTGINFGDPETQTALDGMVASGVFTQPQADALKALGKSPSSLAHDAVGEPVTGADVSIALRNTI